MASSGPDAAADGVNPQDRVALEASPSLVRCRINPKQLYMYIYRSIYRERSMG